MPEDDVTYREPTTDDEPGGQPTGALRIFLNYRREDSSGHAGRLYDDLAERFGEHEVFIDIDKIEPGLEFDETIDRALDNCDVVLALIGRQWLTIADREGRRRLEEPDDFVRLELEAALNRGTRLIPIRVQGAELPSAAELPESLRGLARRQAMELSDQRWRHDVASLIGVLERLTVEKTEREHGERERVEQEEAERQRVAQEAAERERGERERLEQKESERERGERERLEQKESERERGERERLAKEEVEGKRAAEERAELERRERERVEQEEAERRRAAQKQAEREQQERQRAEREEAERQRATQKQAARERQERERAEREEAKRLRAAPKKAAHEHGDRQGIAAWVRRPAVLAVAGIVIVGLGTAIALMLRDDGSATAAETQQGPAPTPSSRVAISGTTRAGNTLTARPGSWRGSPTKFGYQWRRCDGKGGNCAAVAGATTRTYRLTDLDVGRGIRVSVTASNAAGSRTTMTKATSVVAPAYKPPTNSARPTLSDTAREGSSLTVSRGTWQGTKPISYEHVWLRCNTSGSDCGTIAGVRGLAYTLQAQDVGRTIRIEERASNVSGRRAVRSEATSVVDAKPALPSNTGPVDTGPSSTGPIETVPAPQDP